MLQQNPYPQPDSRPERHKPTTPGSITLRGVAWNHTRGFLSVVATAQRFEELHPEISIQWEKRSLQAFADASMEELAAKFDLIVMDHPHTALAATEGLLLPYEDWVPAEFLADQAANSVGASHESYRFSGKQWTLATDAATPIATWRPDLVEKHKLALPQTWEDAPASRVDPERENTRAYRVEFSAFRDGARITRSPNKRTRLQETPPQRR